MLPEASLDENSVYSHTAHPGDIRRPDSRSRIVAWSPPWAAETGKLRCKGYDMSRV